MRPSASETTMTQSLGNMVACEALRQGLYVGKYFMFDRDMSQDDQWLALAKYVPAVSHPVGGNKVLDSTDYYDFDMNQERFVPRPNGWGRPAVNGEYPWKHSDMKDLAYFYVYKLYEQLVSPEKGNLK